MIMVSKCIFTLFGLFAESEVKKQSEEKRTNGDGLSIGGKLLFT
jgi:hypothetical protein